MSVVTLQLFVGSKRDSELANKAKRHDEFHHRGLTACARKIHTV